MRPREDIRAVEARVRRTYVPLKVLVIECECGAEWSFPLRAIGDDLACRACGPVFRIARVRTEPGDEPVLDLEGVGDGR